MVGPVGHRRFLEHAFVLGRLSTRSQVSHHLCQPVEHIVANVKVVFRKTIAVEAKLTALCTFSFLRLHEYHCKSSSQGLQSRSCTMYENNNRAKIDR
ncbi:hypothetical protein Y032_0036g3263 [Ancylostoma ceylanicum]|uniref:Uncharacterized protein n=1 Tax=Ancylostoma ceylanicum TaxID=53326 RepID=A0A016UKC4_9BILA|nr:hypothetical protein Y032_0036g3263 [Ancylostoma ceylanicum]